MLQKWGALLITIVISIVLAILAITPPAPLGLDTPADQFSSARAMKDVVIIAAEPHPTGSAENETVRNYLSDRLTDLEMELSFSSSFLNERSLKRLNRWSGETKSEQEIVNIIGVLPGEDRSKPAILLMAHHDTVWGSPGAADDTVGIASILEIVRALKEAGPQQRDLIVLFTDGEEVGLSGATHFFENHPLRDRIGAVINFEARGGGGTVNMFQTSSENGDVAKLYARSVKTPSTSSLSTFVYSVLPNDTDLTPALKKDYAAYNFANIGDAKYYHSPKIDADALDERTLQHMGSQGLDLTRALLSAKDLPSKKADATFFDLFGVLTIIFAPLWGWVFLIFAAIGFGLSVRPKVNGADIVSGFLKMLGFLGIGGALLYGLNRLSGHSSAADYYDRLAAIPKLEWLAFLVCFSVFFALFGRKSLSENARLGTAIPLFVIAILGQVFAPTAAYFITLPLLLCAGTSFMLQRRPGKKISAAIAIASTSLVAGYMLGLEHLLLLGVGPDRLAVAILPAAIAVLAILPLYAGLSKRRATSLSIIGAAMSLGLALWIRLDPVASTIPLY